ncbi:MAG: hypothetical protein QHH27_03000 [Clostridia bacterium]|nr:hypothetical protein [Clostridia bacterium]MDH7572504.1 hypothetical protein [Clostridia bacterium]
MALFGKREPEQVQILEKDLACQVCGHDRFWRRQAQLNTAVATFFDLDWTNPSATCLICARCGYIHWFLPE